MKRTWKPEDHPEWLILEVDGRLQIRQAQADVALHMIDNPGDVVQLNMGEGKTRVIIPLLLLHWAKPSRHPDAAVVRLHFLDALLGEAFHFLHRTLTASLLERPIFVMPFHRDIQLTEEGARAMRGCLERCRREGGAVLVAPEHRHSLYLKGLELRTSDPKTSEEIRKVEGVPFRDILDESDELLHHRKQLIYAVGALQKLPAQKHRAHAVQALLRILKHRKRQDHDFPCSLSELFQRNIPYIYCSPLCVSGTFFCVSRDVDAFIWAPVMTHKCMAHLKRVRARPFYLFDRR